MGFELSCKDVGLDCPYVGHGETEMELLADAAKHAKEVHGYTDEQLNDPKLLEKIKPLIKQV